MIIFGQPVTKENARKLWDTYKREIIALYCIYFRGCDILMKWTIAGYYWDGKEHYVIYQNEDGHTKMVLDQSR